MRAAIAAALPALLSTVAAQPLAISNAGFEAPAIAAGTFSTTAPPPGWSALGNLNFNIRTVGVLHPSTTTLYPGGAPEGRNVGVVFLMDNAQAQTVFTNRPAGLEQTLNARLQTSTVYTLTVEVGNIANDPNPPHNRFQFGGFPGYRVELLAGNTVIASDDDSLLPAEGTFETSTLRAVIAGTHANAGQRLSIRLWNLNRAPGLEVNFDDLRLRADPVWTDLGGGKSGLSGVPSLVGAGSLAAASTNRLDLTGAAPSTVAILAIGVVNLSAPFLGGTLIPSPVLTIGLPTDASGATGLSFTMPGTTPRAVPLYFQSWLPDATATFGLSASNGLRGTSS